MILLLLSSLVEANDTLRAQFFESRIRPVLVRHCYECHSVASDDVSGGLLLDSRPGWQRGGDSGATIVVGDPAGSRLLEAIEYANTDLQMPPEGKLPKSVIADFRKWIGDGAFDPREEEQLRTEEEFDLEQRAHDHWAWQPPRRFETPQSIDQFIDTELESRSLRRAAPASAEVLIRRLSFDLIGLPPLPREIEHFRAAYELNRENAIESLVARLLNSPQFGEKWASHWFDVMDFSETKGHVTDQERPYAWKYRDYVIEALNADLPYDRFVVEHIAGDLLSKEMHRTGREGQTNVTPTATGVLFMHEMHFMAVDPVQQRWDEIDAQIDVVGKAFLGLTIECARCHDHKFDAISQEDYYALAGFFYSTEQGKQRTASRQKHAQTNAKLSDAEADYETFLNKKQESRVAALTPKNKSGAYFPISEELGIQTSSDTATLLKKMQAIERIDPSWSHWVRAATDVEGSNVPLLVRGEPSNAGDSVPRRFLTAINPTSPSLSKGSGRLWLARQIARADNPLTARVHANRVWHHLFGRGIVATPNDFGDLGERPTHPELLDYLAQRLIETGWSTRSLIREIVMSGTYQQSSRAASDVTDIDPENRWLSHQNRRRLAAEQIRDAMLVTSEALDSTMFGPGVDPYVPPHATANKSVHIPKSGPANGNLRRSVYIKVRRNYFDPFLRTFDFPDRGKPVGRRGITVGPAQALAMLNSPLVHDLASVWGSNLEATNPSTREDRQENTIRRMWLAALGRDPTRDELDTAGQLLTDLRAANHDSPWKDVAHLIYNHPDFIWID